MLVYANSPNLTPNLLIWIKEEIQVFLAWKEIFLILFHFYFKMEYSTEDVNMLRL